MTTFPTWLTGPNGERRVFERAEDVPEGWVDGLHPSVRIVDRILEDGARIPMTVAEAIGDTGPAVADPTPGHSDDLTPAAEHIGMRRGRKPRR
jgi:hypothetical protein